MGFPAVWITLHQQPEIKSILVDFDLAYISFRDFFGTTTAVLFELFDGTTDDELFLVARASFGSQGVVRKAPTSGNDKFLELM